MSSSARFGVGVDTPFVNSGASRADYEALKTQIMRRQYPSFFP
jgi:hypothetical protein